MDPVIDSLAWIKEEHLMSTVGAGQAASILAALEHDLSAILIKLTLWEMTA